MKNTTTAQNKQLPSPQKASGLAFTAATLVPVLLSFIFLTAISMLRLTADENYATQDWYLYANYLLPQIGFLIVTAAYFIYTKKAPADTLRAQKCEPKYFVLATLLQVGLFSLSQLNGWFLKWLEGFGYTNPDLPLPSMDGWGMVGVFLVVAVLAAVMEEIMFRGLILNGLKDLSAPLAALICGGLFALYHQNPAQTLYQFVCGTAFAFVAIRAGSILPTVLAHFLNNAVILLLVKNGIAEFTPTVNTVVLCVSTVCLVGAIIWLASERKEQPAQKGKNVKEFFLYAAVGIAVCALTWLLVLFTGM